MEIRRIEGEVFVVCFEGASLGTEMKVRRVTGACLQPLHHH